MRKLTAADLVSRYESTNSAKSNFDTLVQQVQDHLLPMRSTVVGDTTPGAKKTARIYDSDPTRSLLNLAAQINSLMTDPQSQWFEYETEDDELNERQDVKEYMELRASKVKREMARSNMATQLHEFYIDLPSSCTAGMFISESSRLDRVLNFHTMPYAELCVSENDEGYIDTIYRKVKMSARKMYNRWGNRAPKPALKDYDKGDPEAMHEALHIVMPRHERRIGRRDKLNLPWADIWIDLDAKAVITEGGFHEWPFAIGRWYVTSGENNGRGPGIDNLGDIKTLNKMGKSVLRTGEKIADPPLAVPHEGVIGDWKLYPAGLNYFDPTVLQGMQPFYELTPGANHMPITLEMIQDKRDGIRQGFYTTQLQLIDRREMTAEEVRERSLQNMRVIGPTFGRLENEMLDSLVIRSDAICARAGILPPPPPVLQEKNFKIRYVGPLAKAQQAHEVQALQLSLETSLSWHERYPEANVMDNYDLDKAIRMIHDMDGAPASVLRSMKGSGSVEEIRKTRQNFELEKLRIEQGQLAARAARDAAAADRDMKSA